MNSSLLGKDAYVWYKSKGGKNNAALSATISMKHTTGERPYGITPNIKVELMYSDGVTAAPVYQLKHTSRSQHLLHILSPPRKELKCSPFEDLTVRFRIEEVSFYHASRGGFRLKVSVPHFACTEMIHPAVSDKVITVLSKPNKKEYTRDTRHTIHPKIPSMPTHCKRIRKGEQETTIIMSSQQEAISSIPINELQTALLGPTFQPYRVDDDYQQEITDSMLSMSSCNSLVLTEQKKEDPTFVTDDIGDINLMISPPKNNVGIKEEFPSSLNDVENSGLLFDSSYEQGDLLAYFL